MSVFSEKLNEYITASNIKISALAKLSGVERSYIQKMISGDRIPTSEEVIQQISQTLMLSPNQHRILNEAYSITKMGEAVYYRRVLVKRLIEEIGTAAAPCEPAEPNSGDSAAIPENTVLPIQSRPALTHAFRQFLLQSAANQDKEICLLFQPQNETLADELLLFCRQNPEIRVEHIICFDSELQYQKENRYNLDCIRRVFPLLLSAAEYIPWFHYDSLHSRMGDSSVFPCFALAGNRVLNFSASADCGILYNRPDIAPLFRSIFQNIRDVCQPLLDNRTVSDGKTFWDSYLSGTIQPGVTYYLQYQPCLALFCSMDMVRRQILPDLPGKEEILNFFDKRLQKITLMRGDRQNISFFTEEGLWEFLHTGLVSELPEGIYHPLPRAFRAELLRRMLSCADKGIYKPFFIKTAKFKISHELSAGVEEFQQVRFTLSHPTRGLMSLRLQEKSVAFSFRDFMEYLQDTGLIYPREESLEKLREIQRIFLNESGSAN